MSRNVTQLLVARVFLETALEMIGGGHPAAGKIREAIGGLDRASIRQPGVRR
jgi:hypothetical protein